MRIGIDVDGVLASFHDGFIARIVAVTGRDLFPERPFTIPCWTYPEHFGYTNDEVSAVWTSIKQDRKFWSSLEGYPDTAASLAILASRVIDFRDDVYFITARPGLEAKLQTERWLRTHGFMPTATVLVSSDKGGCARALNLDYYIDDRSENVLDVAIWRGALTRVFLQTQPWNVDCDAEAQGITRIDTLSRMFQ